MATPTPSPEVFWRPEVKLWWPVADKDPAAATRFVTPRLPDSDLAVERCQRRRTCVQAGGYVGLWPMRLARSFDQVLTFEIMPGCYGACVRNCAELANVHVFPFGLGASSWTGASVRPHGTAGSWRVDPGGTEKTDLISIDSLKLTDCDAIILDVEGFEVSVLKGAAETIERCSPVIQVEELDRSKAEIHAHLLDICYKPVARAHKDVIYVRV